MYVCVYNIYIYRYTYIMRMNQVNNATTPEASALTFIRSSSLARETIACPTRAATDRAGSSEGGLRSTERDPGFILSISN